jgi:hypothetical protein
MRALATNLMLLLLSNLLGSAVHAGPIEKLALVSTIGDTMTVVVYRPSVGSNLEQNRRQVFPMPDTTFDDTAIAAAKQAIGRLPVATPMVVVVPTMDAAARESTASAGRLQASAGMKAALQASGASHLLLLTKHRSLTMLKLRHSSTGSGHLEGLGFYIDRSLRTKRADTGQPATGFLAPYAYFQVALVDLATWDILKLETVLASSTVSAARVEDGVDPWDALSASDKVSALQKLIRNETARVVPLLLPSQ